MNIQEITGRNYYATRRRGQITDKTTAMDFLEKIAEEKDELEKSWFLSFDELHPFDEKELADLVLVCFAMAQHCKIDLLKVMEEKMLYNEKRAD